MKKAHQKEGINYTNGESLTNTDKNIVKLSATGYHEKGTSKRGNKLHQ
jgi:hypothetical protein